MKRKEIKALASLFVLSSILSACNSSEPAAKPKANDAPPEPVTIKLMRYQGGYSKGEFDKFVGEPMKQKYPHMTLEYEVLPNGTTVRDLIASGNAPDIFLTGVRSLSDLTDLDFALDVREMSKKNNLDWSIYETSAQEMIKNYGTKGEMFALPTWLNYYVTFYNKDIFDRFGVPYPKDNMTWDEMLDLSKKLTRNEGGVQYRGMWPGQIILIGSSQALPYFEPNSDKLNMTTDAWAKMFKLGKDFYTIPGNEPKGANLGSIAGPFVSEKTLAMLPSYGSSMVTMADPQFNQGLNWDIVTYPVHPDKRGFSAETDGNVLVINKTSKVLEQAFKAAQAMSTDPDLQLDLAKRAGTLPVIKLPKTQEVFGQAFPLLKEKNLKAVFGVKTIDGRPFNKYDQLVRPVINRNFAAYLTGNDDQVTVLRKIQEEATKVVEEAKQAKK